MKVARKSHQRMLLAAAIGSLFAFEEQAAQAADIRVEVTGSNIKRIEGEGALPVQVIDRDEIIRSGSTNAMEIVNLISANNSGGNVSLGNIIGAATFSNQTASLRGLGGSSTLILVNGKRLGTFAGGVNGAEGVNLQAIPFSAIERVEVLKDGASAIYGSDAIGGVINFIMRQDFTGFDGTAWYGAPTRSGGGDQWQLFATVGGGDLAKDKWNAFLSINYQQQQGLDQRDRDFSATSFIPSGASPSGTTSGQTFPGFVYDPVTGAGIGSPGFPDCGPYHIAFGGRCRYDPSQVPGVQSLPETKQLNLFGSARYQINADWQAYVTGCTRSRKRASSSSRRRCRTKWPRRRRRPAAPKLSCNRTRRSTRTNSRLPTASMASRSAFAIAASNAAIATTKTRTRRGKSSPD